MFIFLVDIQYPKEASDWSLAQVISASKNSDLGRKLCLVYTLDLLGLSSYFIHMQFSCMVRKKKLCFASQLMCNSDLVANLAHCVDPSSNHYHIYVSISKKKIEGNNWTSFPCNNSYIAYEFTKEKARGLTSQIHEI